MNARHRGSFYRQRPEREDAYGPTTPRWEPEPYVEDVPLNLQPLTGSVVQTPAGREWRTRWRAFLDPRDLTEGVRVQPDDGLVVTAGRAPERFRVVEVQPRAPGWKDVVVLEQTAEEIP